jgi:MYXO-CTERM domain-containing protein
MRPTLVVCALACAACSPGSLGPVGDRESALVAGGATVYAKTFDGIPAYALAGNLACTSSGATACGSFDVFTNDGIDTSPTNPGGWFQSEGGYGYQCVELATRYLWAKFKVSGWSIGTAQEMCGNHPSSVVTTTSPVAGDLMVFGPDACAASGSGIGSAGHVAVVDGVSGDTIHTTQQNVAMNLDWQRSCASCFLHATANVVNPNDPCTHATLGDGMYCGATLGGDASKLYHCVASATAASTSCACGCTVEANGVPDQCAACADMSKPPAHDLATTPAADDLAPSSDPATPPDLDTAGATTPPSTPAAKAAGCAIAAADAPDPGLALLALAFALALAVRRRATAACTGRTSPDPRAH